MLLIVFHQQDRQPGCTAIVIMDYCTGQAISHCVYVMRRVHRCVFSICVAQKFNAQDKQLARSSRSVVQRVAWSPWKLSQCQWLPLRLLLGWAAATLIATLCAAAYDYPLPASSCCSCLPIHACKTRTAAAGWLRARARARRGGNNIFSHCGFCTVRKIYCMAH